MAVGQALIDQGHFGSDKVQERLDEVNEKWDNLVEMMDSRKRRLTEAVDFHQFLTDADDVDTWMLDILRLVSSDDTGKDEANVQVNYPCFFRMRAAAGDIVLEPLIFRKNSKSLVKNSSKFRKIMNIYWKWLFTGKLQGINKFWISMWTVDCFSGVDPNENRIKMQWIGQFIG